MSDPTFWTPPDSPKFTGGLSDIPDDLDGDLFLETQGNTSEPARTHNELLGLSCGSCDSFSFLNWFERLDHCPLSLETPNCFALLWNRVSILKNINVSGLHTVDYTQGARNDITVLLTILHASIRSKLVREQCGPTVQRMRSILLLLGPSFRPTKETSHLFHAQIEIWIVFTKMFEFICKPNDGRPSLFNTSDTARSANAALGLEPTSTPDACDYLMDIILENLVAFYSKNLDGDFRCTCTDNLWIVLIRFAEKYHSDWFKYLHGKMNKMGVRHRATVFEPRSLESLRPSHGLPSSDDCTSEKRDVWSVYWPILAHTASLHRTYIAFCSNSEVPSQQIQKYSIVIWLIRTQFLGESSLSEKEAQLALRCLLSLADEWGFNIEIIRSLWLYFIRRLDCGFIRPPESDGSTTSSTGLQFDEWLGLVQATVDSELNSFQLFCLLVRKVPWSHVAELNSVIKTPLISLTRQAALHYFVLLGHLLDSFFTCQTDGTLSQSADFGILVDFILECCPNYSVSSELQNWDSGRRCATLQGLQYLITLCKYHWMLRQDCAAEYSLKANIRRLVSLASSIRLSLASSSLTSAESATVPPDRLSSFGLRLELTQITAQFGCDLVHDGDVSRDRIEHLLLFLSISLDSSLFLSVTWTDDPKWTSFLECLFSLVCEQQESVPVQTIRRLLWNDLFPHYYKRIQKQSGGAQTPAQNTLRIARDLASIGIGFVRLREPPANLEPIGKCQPVDLFELFSLGRNVDHSLHFAFCEVCFSNPYVVQQILPAIFTDSTDKEDVSWRFLTVWLSYCLLVKPSCDDRAQNQFSSFEHLTAVGNQVAEFLTTDVAALLGDADADFTLINIAAHYDQFSTFHARMAYKSLASKHLSRLCQLLCDCCSISTTAKENGIGIKYCLVPNVTADTLCSVGFRSAALLVRHCAALLYTPVTSGVGCSSLENLINNFVLPRQLFEWDKLNASELHPDNDLFTVLAIECMRDKLTEITTGLAQLSWRSDAYIGRILRDIIRLYYRNLGPQCIANAVVNSPAIEFRAHLLELSAQEALAGLKRPSSTDESHPSARRFVLKSRSAEKGHTTERQHVRSVLTKWLKLASIVDRNTHSPEVYQRDAPWIVFPILLMLDREVDEFLSSELHDEAKSLIIKYRTAVQSVESNELKKYLNDSCLALERKYNEFSMSLRGFFGIKTE
ncbi:unnamed protein product [Calicophoron daubneyi]|uniref:Protein MMS22-like n=1 Tax=Calicophoron daubneyi TaxID=300641 RepID=A0AAV2TYJ3_CALDB